MANNTTTSSNTAVAAAPEPCATDLDNHVKHQERQQQLLAYYRQLSSKEETVSSALASYNEMQGLCDQYNASMAQYRKYRRQANQTLENDAYFLGYEPIHTYAQGASMVVNFKWDMDDGTEVDGFSHAHGMTFDLESLVCFISQVFMNIYLLRKAKLALESRVRALRIWNEQLEMIVLDRQLWEEIRAIKAQKRLEQEAREERARLEQEVMGAADEADETADSSSQLDLDDSGSQSDSGTPASPINVTDMLIERLQDMREQITLQGRRRAELVKAEMKDWKNTYSYFERFGREAEWMKV